MGHDQDRRDDGDRGDCHGVPRRAASLIHVPRVDWIHNTDLDRLLDGEPDPEL